MPTLSPAGRNVDELAATQSQQLRDEVDDAFQSCSEAKAELEQVPASQRTNVFGRHLKELQKQLEVLLCRSCDIYADLALAYCEEIGEDLLAWVEKHIVDDLDSAHEEQRVYSWIITLCDGRDTAEHLNGSVWRGPTWLCPNAVRIKRGRPLTESELLSKLDLKDTKGLLRKIHLRLWSDLSRTVYWALFNATNRIEFERKLISAKHIPKKRVCTAADSARRAREVANMIEELNVFRSGMGIPEDYDDLRSSHPDYKIFKLAAKHSSFKAKLIAIGERPQLIGLAQEAAALHFKKSLSTIQTDWKRCKPPRYRRVGFEH